MAQMTSCYFGQFVLWHSREREGRYFDMTLPTNLELAFYPHVPSLNCISCCKRPGRDFWAIAGLL